MSKLSLCRKSEILGMPFGTACYKLRKMVMFDILQRHGETVCFKCGQTISNADELTLEHKEPWQTVGASLFWDVRNIAFSHSRCNLRAGFIRREIVDGNLWCSACKQFLSISRFHKERRQRTGYALYCKNCFNVKRRKIKAQGDCVHCGAKRGTKPFRVTHNICMTCANHINNNRANKQRKLARALNQSSHSSKTTS
jgi:hypothetical protein